ncbi:MAG TPA: CBS domain-containing protein [Kofleriaceae bacterium]|nr:CBS domain-containing protein [Kofleriaceae bacterium]
MSVLVAELMAPCPLAVHPRARLSMVESALEATRWRHLLVMANDQVVGFIAARDVARAAPPDLTGAARQGWMRRAVAADIMSAPVMVVSASERAASAAAMLHQQAISCLPVVDGTWPVGLLTTSDFVRHAIELLAAEDDLDGAYLAVARLMTRPPVVVVRPDDDLAIADARMRSASVHHVPVLDGEELVGILADHDVFAGLAGQAPAAGDGRALSVRDFMTAHPLTVTADEEAALAAAMLLAHHIGSLPVIARKGLVGIVTERDFLTYCLDRGRST